ncbi:MAG: hypothetical protein RR978_08655 [Oscillospiraceae bacterium]
MNEQQAGAMLAFLEQYSAFLKTMLENEKEKLTALLSNSLERIEHSILTAQADAKQLESMEQKRMSLQIKLGCPGYTLQQVAAATPISMRARMDVLCSEVREDVDEIRYHNDKSMNVARTNITKLNPDSDLAKPKAEHGTENPYARANHVADTTSILETKA